MAQGTALSAGAVIGTGVISMPALAAAVAGPASLLAWLALVVLSAPLAWTFAALGARHPDGGGVATYVRLAFGARAAAAVGWIFYFAVPLGAPAAAAFTLLHGAGNGVLTIAKGTLPLAIFGPGGYGLRQGILGAPSRFVQACAPFLFGLLIDAHGAASVAVSAVLSLCAFAALLALRPAPASGAERAA